ncbi:cysteine-rich KTR domain-containing protein [Lachnospiraceae bacterium 29-84]
MRNYCYPLQRPCKTSGYRFSVKKRQVASNMKYEWIYCPICKKKTHNKFREDTVLKNYPLYCPKCKRETIINAKNMQVFIITEPDT